MDLLFVSLFYYNSLADDLLYIHVAEERWRVMVIIGMNRCILSPRVVVAWESLWIARTMCIAIEWLVII